MVNDMGSPCLLEVRWNQSSIVHPIFANKKGVLNDEVRIQIGSRNYSIQLRTDRACDIVPRSCQGIFLISNRHGMIIASIPRSPPLRHASCPLPKGSGEIEILF